MNHFNALLATLVLTAAARAEAFAPQASAEKDSTPVAALASDTEGTQSEVSARELPQAIHAHQELQCPAQDDVDALSNLARLKAWNGDYDRAIVLFREALAKTPRDSGLLSDLGDVLAWAQRFGEAEVLYEEALANAPQHHEAMKGLARVQLMRGDLEGAQGTLLRALALYPEDADLSKAQAQLYTQAGDFDRAVDVLLAAEERRPDDLDQKRHLAEVYQLKKDFARAVRLWARVAQMDPDSPTAQVALARSYLGLGKLKLAREHAALALRMRPSDHAASELVAELDRETEVAPARDVAELLEIASFVLLLPLVFLGSRKIRRNLGRHRAARVFCRYVVPAFVLFIVIGHVAGGWLPRWMDVRLFEAATEAALFLGLGLSFVAVLQFEPPVREFAGQVVLALGAHPDDIELGCAGFLLKLKDSGARVYGVTLTRGEKGGEGDRCVEARRAAEFMKLDGYSVLSFPDTELSEQAPALKAAIEARVKELRPTLVLTHTGVDVHGDHRAVHAATREAARGVPTVLCYEDVSTPNQFVPNWYVDIGSYVEEHLRACAFHRTQEDRSYMDPRVIEGRAAHRGMQAGTQFALAFQAMSLLR